MESCEASSQDIQALGLHEYHEYLCVLAALPLYNELGAIGQQSNLPIRESKFLHPAKMKS